jgi:hypothetical protein
VSKAAAISSAMLTRKSSVHVGGGVRAPTSSGASGARESIVLTDGFYDDLIRGDKDSGGCYGLSLIYLLQN